jgi:glutamyl-tRNA synthetase
MVALPLDAKIPLLVPYVQQAGWATGREAADIARTVRQIAQAAGDRLKTAGDILDYVEFFCADDELPYDAKAFEKRLRPPAAAQRLQGLRTALAIAEPFDAAGTEAVLRRFLEEAGLQMGDIVHPLRVAVTGKAVGLGIFDTLAILGRDRVTHRIDRTLQML